MQTGFLLSPDQCRAARALVNWTQAELGSLAGIIRAKVVAFERGQTVSAVTPRRLQTALERAGVAFVRADAIGGAGVVLRGREAEKRRDPYPFDSDFYGAQARLIAQLARVPAYFDLREGFLSLSRDYFLHAQRLASAPRDR
jgi:transcriptional regulator with XRE-family HTH domain